MGSQYRVWSDEGISLCECLCQTTTGNDIFRLEKTLSKYSLKWNLLKNVTSDGDKNMCGTEKGLVGQTNKTCENAKCIRYFKPMVIHGIISAGIV